jgi:hypothetical protein
MGFARLAARFDERGNKIEEAYFGVNGHPIVRIDVSAARIIWRYDENDKPIQKLYFDTSGGLLKTEDLP